MLGRADRIAAGGLFEKLRVLAPQQGSDRSSRVVGGCHHYWRKEAPDIFPETVDWVRAPQWASPGETSSRDQLATFDRDEGARRAPRIVNDPFLRLRLLPPIGPERTGGRCFARP